MEKQFATYEIALKLKEIGFNEECLAYFNPDEDLIYGIDIKMIKYAYKYHKENESVLAPLWQQITDWFREKYNLFIELPKPDEWNIGKWSVKIISLDESIILEEYVGQPYYKVYRCYNNFNEAREQAILKAIELYQKKS